MVSKPSMIAGPDREEVCAREGTGSGVREGGGERGERRGEERRGGERRDARSNRVMAGRGSKGGRKRERKEEREEKEEEKEEGRGDREEKRRGLGDRSRAVSRRIPAQRVRRTKAWRRDGVVEDVKPDLARGGREPRWERMDRA